jgi:hypothetical protein
MAAWFCCALRHRTGSQSLSVCHRSERCFGICESESGPIYICDYTGAITVTIDGKPFTRTWWDMGGDTVTDFSPVAKAQLGTWDTRYDNDHANWLRSRP